MDKINSTLDERRAEREHETRIQDTAQLTLGMIRPAIQFQTSMLRLIASLCEAAARNAETTVANIADQARPQQHDQQQDRDRA